MIKNISLFMEINYYNFLQKKCYMKTKETVTQYMHLSPTIFKQMNHSWILINFMNHVGNENKTVIFTYLFNNMLFAGSMLN